MKTRSTRSPLCFCIPPALLIWAVMLTTHASATPPRTFWTGPNTNFAQTSVPLGAAPVADVLIRGAVSLARNGNHWLYNTNVDTFGAALGTPSDTEWAFGSISNVDSLTFQSFDSYRDFDLSARLVTVPPSPMVVHLINENIYFSLTFTAWPRGGGLISYTRSTPAVVVSGPPPTVTVTNPANGAVFAAPANVSIAANASVSNGTVTNVTFFLNNSAAGSRQTAPFSITANGLAAGPYALTAVATAAGISATSSVVNISVVTPVATSLSPPSVANNEFTFDFSANSGLRYVIETSSNLVDWTPLLTNMASGDSVSFTNDISGGLDFYRVGRLPNP